MNPSLLTRDVAVELAGSEIVADVTLEVDPGEIFGIVGPNGAGKTTLLRVLAGDVAPTSGQAELGGVDPATTPLAQLALLRAYLGPPSTTDVPFTVREVVTMGRHPHRPAAGDPAADAEIVDRTMSETDVIHLAERRVRHLSTGEQQRVALARALAQDTPVLLLDEPTSSLDIGHQEMTMNVIRAAAAEGVAVAMVLHDLNLAAAHADRLLLLDGGRSAAIGTPTEVLQAERLSTVYRQPLVVVPHPRRNCPLVLTVGSEG